MLDEVEAAAASDLHRSRASAEALASGRGWGPVTVLRGLRERGAGRWTGLTRTEIDERWPDALRATPVAIPDGETVEAVTARAVVALHRIADLHPGRSVVAVSHGALIRTVVAHLGATPAPVPNLAGLWVEVTDRSLQAGGPAGPLGDGAIEAVG